MDTARKLLAICITILLLVLAPLLIIDSSSSKPAYAADEDLYEKLKKLEEELEKIKNSKLDLENKINSEEATQSSLTSQISTLSNSIAALELDIAEKEIDIEKKETEIKILEEEITDDRHLIQAIEKDVYELESTADDIIKTIYVDSKTNSVIDILLTSDQSQSFFSQIQYHTALGSREQNTLEELQTEKSTLEEQKQKLEDNKLEIEKLAEQIKKQKEELEKDQEQMSAQIAQKNTLLQNSQIAAAYYGQQYDDLSDEEMKKEAELDYVLQQLVNTPSAPKGYVVAGQIIATEGSNGCSTGPHTHFGLAIDTGGYIDGNEWVNPCSYLPTRTFWWGTCGGNGQIRYPYNDPFYSSRGYTWYHKGLDLYAGSDKYVRAAHKGYYFEETSPCSSSWCSYGCSTPIQTCIKVCEDVNCSTGKVSIYCHVNFL